jgi:hypothetical protein
VTEAEWKSWTDPQQLLVFLEGTASHRKLRLFSCACCRRVWHLLTDQRSRKAVESAERYADGTMSEEALSLDAEDARGVYQDAKLRAEVNPDADRSEEAFASSSWTASAVYPRGYYPLDATEVSLGILAGVSEAGLPVDSERIGQIAILHDIFGDPFHPVAVDPNWLSSTVTSLAQAIYADRAFDRMPILADALEDAGCTNQDILDHCRQPGEHCRGCWVVDLLLGKE